MPPVGFEPTISAGERAQTYALDRVATGTGTSHGHISHDNVRQNLNMLPVVVEIGDGKGNW